jgi:nucleoside-diphosphate-sugar epimerase
LAGTVEDAAGEPFLIGGSETPSLNAVIAALAEVLNNQDQHIVRLPAWPFWLAGWGCELLCRPLGVSPPIYRRRVEFFTNNRAYDIGKAQSILGYQPRVKMREGLKHTADWYRANALL